VLGSFTLTLRALPFVLTWAEVFGESYNVRRMHLGSLHGFLGGGELLFDNGQHKRQALVLPVDHLSNLPLDEVPGVIVNEVSTLVVDTLSPIELTLLFLSEGIQYPLERRRKIVCLVSDIVNSEMGIDPDSQSGISGGFRLGNRNSPALLLVLALRTVEVKRVLGCNGIRAWWKGKVQNYSVTHNTTPVAKDQAVNLSTKSLPCIHR
jgi:hypothetical protein